MSTNPRSIHTGTFTPRAEVRCSPSCDSPNIDHEVDAFDNNVAFCDRCGDEVVVRSDVAACQRVKHAINEDGCKLSASLDQTGGMCVATHVRKEEEPYFVLVTCNDGPWVVGGYFTTGGPEGDGSEREQFHADELLVELPEGTTHIDIIWECLDMFETLRAIDEREQLETGAFA